MVWANQKNKHHALELQPPLLSQDSVFAVSEKQASVDSRKGKEREEESPSCATALRTK